MVSDGVKSLAILGETNLYDYVQASKDEVMIYNLLDRFTRGDITALLAKKGQYLDVTGLPTTLAEAEQLMINVNDAFNRLSREERAKFDGVDDYIQVIAKSDVAHLKEIFGIGAKAAVDVKEGDVVES